MPSPVTTFGRLPKLAKSTMLKFLTNIFRKKRLGTGQGQIFKEGIKALAFEIYRGISILHIAQLEDEKIIYKYLFFTSKVNGDKRDDTFYYGVGRDLENCKELAFKEIDNIAE